MKIWCTTRLVLPHRCTGAKQASPSHSPIWSGTPAVSLLSVLSIYLLLLHPVSFSPSLQMCKKSKISGLYVCLCIIGLVFPGFKKEAVRSLCFLFMKNSPLADLLGVGNRRSTGTWFLGAFKKLPGGKLLRCPKMHLVWSFGHFCDFFFSS